jgi:prophage regulatory protein
MPRGPYKDGNGYPKGLAGIGEATGMLRMPQVCAMLGMGRVAVYDRIKKGEFPRPMKLGYRTSCWHARDVEDYISKALAERDKKEADEYGLKAEEAR